MKAKERKKYPHLYKKHLRYGKTIGRSANLRAVNKYMNSEKGRATRRRYYLSHRAERNLYMRIWKKDFTLVEAEKAKKALKKFRGRCHACGIKKSSQQGWHLDHKNRKYRGILCHYCNVALGFAGDSIPRLFRLIKYLRRVKCV